MTLAVSIVVPGEPVAKGRPRNILCASCKALVEGAKPMQRYCEACSTEKHRQRKEEWDARHKKRSGTRNPKRRADRDGHIARGAEIADQAARSIAWYADSEPSLHTLMRVAIPFDYSLSKNRLWSHAAAGHVFMRREIKANKDAIASIIRAAAAQSNWRWCEGKVWLDLLVQKPNHRGDAVNVLDLLCDAAKIALGVDDRWFSIRRLDWEIKKTNPMLYLGIGQEITEPHRICSYCGQSKPQTMFRTGRRECATCRKAAA